MGDGRIRNDALKTIYYNFTNLAQYSPSGYYLQISGVKEKIGLPSTAKLIAASVSGWSGLGAVANVELASDDQIYIFFASGYTITSDSRMNVRFVYQ